MNKVYTFQYSNHNDEEFDSKEYPTLEEAQLAAKELEEQEYAIGVIEEIRI